jgi:flagellar basal-body rod modification protein FlgD
MQKSIESLSSSLRSTQVMNGTTLVGHDVVAAADSFTYGGVGVAGQVDVPAGAQTLQIRITDSTGALVRELEVNPAAGTNAFTWDGTRADGAAVPSGEYDIQAIAKIGGSNESLEVLMSGRVSSVTIDSTGTGLTLNTASLGPVSMNNIRSVM